MKVQEAKATIIKILKQGDREKNLFEAMHEIGTETAVDYVMNEIMEISIEFASIHNLDYELNIDENKRDFVEDELFEQIENIIWKHYHKTQILAYDQCEDEQIKFFENI